MNENARRPELGQFFIDKYKKLVGYFQANYSDLSDMEVEDVVSDLMADLLERVDVLDRVENLSAYIYRAVRNRALDYLRRRKKTVSLDEDRSGEADNPMRGRVPELIYDMTAELEGAEIRDRLLKALDTLEPSQRAVWIATELEGRSFQDLSDEWDVPLGTLLARKHRAKAALQKELRDFNKP